MGYLLGVDSSLDPSRSAILLDFDGTLAPIVEYQGDAAMPPGAEQVLTALVDRVALVAVVSGRPSSSLRERISVPGLQLVGVYGLEGLDADEVRLAAIDLRDAVAGFEGVWVEAKGPAVAVHFRQSPDPPGSREQLEPLVRTVAAEYGLEVFEGKMVWEAAVPGEPRKAGAVRRLLDGRSDLTGVLYAGDDLEDMTAFDAVRAFANADSAEGRVGVCVCVRGPETPTPLSEAADVIVEGTDGLLEFLRSL